MGNDDNSINSLSDTVLFALSKYGIIANGTAIALLLGAIHTNPIPRQQFPQVAVALWLFFGGLVFALSSIISDTLRILAGRIASSSANIEKICKQIQKLQEEANEVRKQRHADLAQTDVEAASLLHRLDNNDAIIKSFITSQVATDFSKYEKASNFHNRLSGGLKGLSFGFFCLALSHLIILECPVSFLALLEAYGEWGGGK